MYCEERAGMTPFTAPRWHRRVYKEPKRLTRRSTSTTNPSASQASSSGRRRTCDREIMYTIKVSTRTLAVVVVAAETTSFRIARSSLAGAPGTVASSRGSPLSRTVNASYEERVSERGRASPWKFSTHPSCAEMRPRGDVR